MRRLAAVLILLALAVSAGWARAAQERIFVRSRYLMGTLVEIKARGEDEAATQAAINEAFDEIARLDRLMSHWRDDSQVARINAEAGKAPVAVAPEVLEVIRRALGASRMTGGAFDITAASVSALWQIDGENPRVPSKAEIRSALPNVGWRHVRIDEKEGTVYLDSPGVRIGLGGIAKGYAVDRAVGILRSRGVRSAILTAGGDSGIVGRDGDRPWRIGVRHPRATDRTVAWFDATDTTVHTSGDYERFMMVKGKRYGHILDPSTGWPVSRAWSVTVITKDGTLGDALATGIFVMGPGQGLRFAGSLPGVEALIVDTRGKVTMTPGLRGRAHLTP